MTSLLQTINGLTVTNVVELHGYVQLHFGDQIGLSIYNEMAVNPPSTPVARLIGKMVTSVKEGENAIEIAFLGGTQIVIDMHRQAYRGPEALELNRQGASAGNLELAPSGFVPLNLLTVRDTLDACHRAPSREGIPRSFM